MECQVELLDVVLPRLCSRDQARGTHLPLRLSLPGRAPLTVATDGYMAVLTDRQLAIQAAEPVPAIYGIERLIEAPRERAVEIGVDHLLAWCGDPVWLGPGVCPDCKGKSTEAPVECSKCCGDGTCWECDQDCPECDGEGKVGRNCERCRSTGAVPDREPDARPGAIEPGGAVVNRVLLGRAARAFASFQRVTLFIPPSVEEPIVLWADDVVAIVMPYRSANVPEGSALMEAATAEIEA